MFYLKRLIVPVNLNRSFWFRLFFCMPRPLFFVFYLQSLPASEPKFVCLSLCFGPCMEPSLLTSWSLFCVSVAGLISCNLLCEFLADILSIATVLFFSTRDTLMLFVLYSWLLLIKNDKKFADIYLDIPQWLTCGNQNEIQTL